MLPVSCITAVGVELYHLKPLPPELNHILLVSTPIAYAEVLPPVAKITRDPVPPEIEAVGADNIFELNTLNCPFIIMLPVLLYI